MTTTYHIAIISDSHVFEQLLLQFPSIASKASITTLKSLTEAVDPPPDLLILDSSITDIGGSLPDDAVIILLTTSDDNIPLHEQLTPVFVPVDIHLLAELVIQHIKQLEQHSSLAVIIGPYRYHPLERKLTYNQHAVLLSQKEAALLNYFLTHPGMTLSKETLSKEIWGHQTTLETHTLETHLYRLRQKLQKLCPETELIVTKPDGYSYTPL